MAMDGERTLRIRPFLVTLVGVVTLAVAGAAINVSPAAALTSSLVQVTGFGTNPGADQMWEYVPTTVAAHPAILVVMHFCGGSGPTMFTNTRYAALADQFGYIVIYPSATRGGNCFDV